MVLRPRAFLTSYVPIKDAIPTTTFELTFFERYWSMAMGRECACGQLSPCDNWAI